MVTSVKTCAYCFSLVKRQTDECCTDKVIKMMSITAVISSIESFRDIL